MHALASKLKNKRWRFALLALLLVVTLALAKDYAFPISAAGPAYVSTTFASDQSAEFDGANRIARDYIHYLSIIAQIFSTSDTVYVVYVDGQIAKFKMISPTDTIRLRFVEKVTAVPGGAVKPTELSPSTGIPHWERSDFVNDVDNNSWYEQKERVGVVTVGPIERWSYFIHAPAVNCVTCHGH